MPTLPAGREGQNKSKRQVARPALNLLSDFNLRAFTRGRTENGQTASEQKGLNPDASRVPARAGFKIRVVNNVVYSAAFNKTAVTRSVSGFRFFKNGERAFYPAVFTVGAARQCKQTETVVVRPASARGIDNINFVTVLQNGGTLVYRHPLFLPGICRS